MEGPEIQFAEAVLDNGGFGTRSGSAVVAALCMSVGCGCLWV